MKYLIDTDWAVDHLHNEERVVSRLRELAPAGLGISIVSLAELYEGVFNSTDPEGNEQALARFIDGIDVVPLDDEACRIFGRERGRLRKAGMRVGDMDLLIGATCLRHGLMLLSNNRRHFELIEGLQVVSV